VTAAGNTTDLVYRYRDRAANVVYEVVRRPGKRFMQRRRAPDGDLVWNLDGVDRVPYRWPQLEAAIAECADIYVVEGEKDADRLAALGLCATTGAGGASWRWPDAWAEHFRGAGTVYVLADADEPGRTAANHRANVIALAVHDVRVVEDWPGVGDNGGDVSDWLDAGHDRADLERHAAAGHPPARSNGEVSTNGKRPAAGAATLPFTDLGNARRLVAAHGHDLRYAPQLDAWFTWDGTRWAEDLTGEVHRRAKAVADGLLDEADRAGSSEERRKAVQHWERSQHAARLAATVTVAATEPGVPVTVDQLDVDPWALNVANGIIDLRTGRLRAHDRRDLVTKLAPVEYNPAVEAPTWTKFLNEVFAGDDELVSFVQRLVGYSITGDVSAQVLPIAHGPGANGKSTFLGVLKAVLGDYATSIDPALLIAGDHTQHPTGLMELRGARFVATIETEQDRRLAESLVKQLTGGDAIAARRMRQDYVTFAPTHKLWMAANHLPRVRGTDHAIWRRLAVVPFTVTFDGPRLDPSLPAKLIAEAPGILAWAVQGVAQWLDNGLAVPKQVQAATDGYRGQEDHVGRFLTDCCRIGDDVGEHLEAPASTLRHAYEAWCAEQGERPWTAKAVGAELGRRGYDRYQSGRAKTWTWIGFDVLTDQSPLPSMSSPGAP
jgi:putative DNA primase/helicase